MRRVLGTAIPKFWLEVWVRPIVALVPFAVGTYLVERWWSVTNLALFFAQVALVLPLAGVGAWLLSLAPEEKKSLRSFWPSKSSVGS